MRERVEAKIPGCYCCHGEHAVSPLDAAGATEPEKDPKFLPSLTPSFLLHQDPVSLRSCLPASLSTGSYTGEMPLIHRVRPRLESMSAGDGDSIFQHKLEKRQNSIRILWSEGETLE